MNAILDLPGPQFLFFFWLLSLLVIVAARQLAKAFENSEIPNLGEPDAYLVAHLRDGPTEAIRVCIVSLLDRGLLEAQGTKITAMQQGRAVRRPLERKVLDACLASRDARSLFTDAELLAACEKLAKDLQHHGLEPSSAERVRRFLIGAAAVISLWALGLTKLWIALDRGYTNVEFLVLTLVAIPIVAVLAGRPKRTPAGDRLIEDYQSLFARLRVRAASLVPGGATNEITLLAGIFGLRALEGETSSRVTALFPIPVGNSSSSSDSSSSCSSCSSSSSSCSSSSCGGGGGCGGCGGGGH